MKAHMIPGLAQDDRLRQKHALCVKRCGGFHEWTPAAVVQSSGLLIPRHLNPEYFPDLQQRVETVAQRLHEGEDTLVRVRIPIVVDDEDASLPHSLALLSLQSQPKGILATMPVEVMQDIRKALSQHFPDEFVELVLHDISCICMAMTRIVKGKSNGLELKIELIGENACKRWHFDNFAGRSIVTYCGMSGTEFCDSPSIRLEEVRSIASSGGLVPSSQSAQVGDILFIKGAKYSDDERCG